MTVEILHRDDLQRRGFAGLREHRLVMDSRVFGARTNPGTWGGIGSLVYLADATFLPKGETGLHPHRQIDVMSLMVDGRILHHGSLEDGGELRAGDVQVQSAGAEGFEHNEVNPDDDENRMLQLWLLPETSGSGADYEVSHLAPDSGMTRVYGGRPGDAKTRFESGTLIEVGRLAAGGAVTLQQPFLAYVYQGCGTANGASVADGDLFRGDALDFTAQSDAQLFVARTIEG